MREKLPVIYPSYSTDWNTGTSASVSSDVMTIATASNIPSVNDEVIITGLTYNNAINSVTTNLPALTAIIVCDGVHEYTEGFSTEVIISGANEAEWNDTFEIVSVPSRYEVQIKINTDISGSPTGSPVAQEINLPRYNSLFTVSAVSGAGFSVPVINAPDGTLIGSPEYILLNNVNVSSDIDLERIMNAYTKQSIDKVWIFLIAGATLSSRSREGNTDFDQSFKVGEDRIIHTQENLSVFAIFPTFTKVSAVQYQDMARNDLRQALLNLLVGYVPSSSLCSPSDMIYYVADGVETYNASYYIHRYDFAVNVDITQDDTYVADSFAVRKITSNYIDEDTEEIRSTDLIDYTEI